MDIKQLSVKKDILIELDKAQQSISKITMDISIYSSEYTFVAHLLQSVGFLRDSIRELSNDIIKQDKKENGNR